MKILHFSVWLIIHLIAVFLLVLFVDKSERQNSSWDAVFITKGPFCFHIIDKESVRLVQLSDKKITEPIPSTVEHMGRSYYVRSIGFFSMIKYFDWSDVVIPDSVESIGVGAFLGAHTLTNITLSANLDRINAYAFMWCTELRSVYFRSDAPPKKIDESAFTHCHPELTFYYPEEYKANWPETLNGIPCRPWNPEESANQLSEEPEKTEEQTESFSP